MNNRMTLDYRSKYLIVDGNNVTACDRIKGLLIEAAGAIIFENYTMEILDNGVMKVIGDVHHKVCSFGKDYISDFVNKDNIPREEFWKFGYKNIFDRIRKVKSPYVSGLSFSEKSKRKSIILNNFVLVMEE